MSNWIIADFSSDGDGGLSIKQKRVLTIDEFEELTGANQWFRRILSGMTFKVLSHNYRTFVALEREVVALLASGRGIRADDEVLTAVVTAVVNFLTSMRMFLDHSEADLKRRDAEDGGTRFSSWKKACSAAYDENCGFRFLYRFRNYIQHVGLPISNLELSSALDSNDQGIGHIFLGESPTQLVKVFDGWSTVGPELEALSTELDLSEQIHVSMECLIRISEALLREGKPELAASAATFKKIIGDLDSFSGVPILAQVAGNPGKPTLKTIELDITALQTAEQIVAS